MLSAAVMLVLQAGAAWPDFRGPTRDGHAARDARPPLEWSESRNVDWKRAIHGLGWSSPVIRSRHLWLTTASRDGKELHALCLDTETGRIVWDRRVFDVAEPAPIRATNSYASASPVTDGERVFVHYGTYGTACLEAATGRALWSRRDLKFDPGEAGPGASPILHDGMLIVQCDGMDVQFVIAMDAKTGRTRWKTARSHPFGDLDIKRRKAYATPLVVEAGGRTQLLSPGAQAAYSYDPSNGRELWRIEYRTGGFSNVSRPVMAGGLAILNTGFGKAQLRAVRPDGSGNVTDSHVAWKHVRSVPRQSSPLFVAGLLYMVSDDGIASALDASDGSLVWRSRLGGSYASSPIAAADRIYFSNQQGVTTVIRPGRAFRKLAENRLDAKINASPAAVGDALYVRTETHLYRIRE